MVWSGSSVSYQPSVLSFRRSASGTWLPVRSRPSKAPLRSAQSSLDQSLAPQAISGKQAVAPQEAL
eukprot:scaffold28943_cov35-Phaeocystis_antarctica.AAC.1